MMIVIANVCPPIPVRDCDWIAHWDDEEGLVGYGATREAAINDLLDATDVEEIAKHFRIETREQDTLRGPEHGYWAAHADGVTVYAPWKDQAIVDCAFKLAVRA